MYVKRAQQYVDDVLSGKKLACKWVRLACKRHKKDLTKDWEYEYSHENANRACQFIELLPHIEGTWKTPNITLEPWQCFIICSVFGWVNRVTKLRRFKVVYSEVPRKNAKSTLSAGVALYMLTMDNENGAQVYSAATTRDQAKVVFRIAKEMSRRSIGLRKKSGLTVHAHNLTVMSTASYFEPLSSDADTLEGRNVHAGIIDELHAHRNRQVFDVIDTATGSRSQPLIWIITTAGSNRAGVCYEQHKYLENILSGKHDDETFFGLIYTIDEGDDWTDPATWEKANPNYGVSVNPEDLARKCNKAQQLPSSQNACLTKHLDIWVNADVK